jgi:hypothetical protein
VDCTFDTESNTDVHTDEGGDRLNRLDLSIDLELPRVFLLALEGAVKPSRVDLVALSCLLHV